MYFLLRMDYAGLIKSEIPPCILIKQFLDSELIAKPKSYPTFTHFIHYLREAIEIAKISLISEEDKEVNESFLENLQKELEGLENWNYSEDISLELCILINQFVERFPTLLYAFMRCSYRFYAKENEEAFFEISAVGMHPVTFLSRSGYEDWESIQAEIISQTEAKLRSAEFFKESQGTDFMYRLNKLFLKVSIFGYIGRRSISEGAREKERESKAIMILIEEVEKIVEENKALVENFPFREILLTYGRNQQNGGYFFNKGRVDLDNLIHYQNDEDLWGIHYGNDKTKQSINLYLEKNGEEANSKNIVVMTLYLLLQIFKNRSFDEDKPMSGIVSFYYEPAILLGHDFQEFGEFIEGIETPFVKFHLQYLDGLFKRSFDIFESNFRSLIGHTFWINQYEEPFYEEVVDIFLALLITRWTIFYKPEETEECFQRLTLFFQNFFTFEKLDERFSQYLKALLKYSLIEYSKNNKILIDLFVLGIEGDSEDLEEYISKFQKTTDFTSRKEILERVVNLDDNGLRSFLYNVIREAEEQLSKFAFTEIIRRNWLPETHEEQIAYNLRTGNWEELCKIEEEQVIQVLRNMFLEDDEIDVYTSREEYDEILSRSVDKSRIISLLDENNLAIDLLIEIVEKNNEHSSKSIFSLRKLALNGNSKAIEYLLSIDIDSISVESEKATIFVLGELAKIGNSKAIDQVLSYCKKKFNEKETRTDRQNISSSFRVYNSNSQVREDFRLRGGLVDLLLSIQSDKVKDFLLELARIESPYQNSIIRKLDDLDDQ